MAARHGQAHGFRHEALFYAGEEEFMSGTLPFIREAVEAEEPILVAVSDARAQAIRAELNGDGDHVRFLDMPNVGKNPARIIPAWRDFVDEHAGAERGVRGIGEPIWRGRTPAELVECRHHESLLNVAFSDARGFWLLCPYDVDTLDPEVVGAAKRNHPYISNGEASRMSHAYVEPEHAPGPFEGELPPAAGRTHALAFGRAGLREVRAFVAAHAGRMGLGADRVADLVLAASELATNSVVHAGGHGTVRVWQEPDRVLCEVRDGGRLQHPLVGRERPSSVQLSGRGLWLVNHMCDLVQMRSHAAGSVVRVHMSL